MMVLKIKQFQLDCSTFLTQMMKKLFERSPLKQAVVRYCRIFDPKVIASYSKEATKKALKSLLFQLLDRKLITAKYSDNVMKELEEFIHNEVFKFQPSIPAFGCVLFSKFYKHHKVYIFCFHA